MKLSEYGLDLIKRFEGLRLEAYQCSAGVWTIGYGHIADVRPKDSIDEMRANSFLLQDVAVSESAVGRFVTVDLSQHQFDALVSLTFNIGAGHFRSSTLLQKLNAEDYSGASKEFLRWVIAGGKLLPGLVRRRAAEKEIFMRGYISE